MIKRTQTTNFVFLFYFRETTRGDDKKNTEAPRDEEEG